MTKTYETTYILFYKGFNFLKFNDSLRAKYTYIKENVSGMIT